MSGRGASPLPVRVRARVPTTRSNSCTYMSPTQVSNVNNGGSDDGVGGVLAEPCRRQMNSSLCGDTNSWDMLLK